MNDHVELVIADVKADMKRLEELLLGLEKYQSRAAGGVGVVRVLKPEAVPTVTVKTRKASAARPNTKGVTAPSGINRALKDLVPTIEGEFTQNEIFDKLGGRFEIEQIRWALAYAKKGKLIRQVQKGAPGHPARFVAAGTKGKGRIRTDTDSTDEQEPEAGNEPQAGGTPGSVVELEGRLKEAILARDQAKRMGREPMATILRDKVIRLEGELAALR